MPILNDTNKLTKTAKTIRDWIVYILNYNSINKTIDARYKPLSQQNIIEYNFARYNGPQRYVCFAPFNNLFFDIRGKIHACNVNRDYELGDITKDKIHDIWFGQNSKNLREHITNHDFSLGCQRCAHAILSKNYTGLFAINYDSTKQIKKYPSRLEFEISNTCNLACKMCNGYLSSTYNKHFHQKEAIPSVYTNDFIEQLKEFIPHALYAKFSGGEPFLIDLYYDIWSMFIELNPKCGMHIQTNGLVLNQKVKKILEKGRFNIGISLDGATKTTYENIRLYGNFERLLENLSYFHAYCKQKNTVLNIAFVPSIENCYEVVDFIKIANSYNASISFSVLWEPQSMAIWTLSANELEQLLLFYEQQTFETQTYTEHKNIIQFISLKNQIKKWLTEAREREKLYPIYEKLNNNQLIENLVQKLVNFDNDENTKDIFSQIIKKNPREYYFSILSNKLVSNPTKIRQLLIKMNTYNIERVHFEINNYFHLQ